MKLQTPRILPSEITSRDLFLDRRRVLRYAAAGAAFGALGSGSALGATIAAPGAKLAYTHNAALSPPTTTSTSSAPTSPIRQFRRAISSPCPGQ
jgi:hypothetical protein